MRARLAGWLAGWLLAGRLVGWLFWHGLLALISPAPVAGWLAGWLLANRGLENGRAGSAGVARRRPRGVSTGC